ncbi:MAG TPA: hypothetical protein DCL48_15710, partial [Alphaproteobacteria bacterium]|nr:hypothetical protein [Alphaproteobacteria bacterium]
SDLGGAALYLLSDLSGGVTGEVHYVDSGYNIIGMPETEALKALTPADAPNGQDEQPAQRSKTVSAF